MECRRISFENYRNISLTTAEFSPGMNVLWGMNAQGKSNILEGIYYFARGKSFRGAREKETIMFGAPYAAVEMDFCPKGAARPTTFRAEFPRTGKRAIYRNGAKLGGTSEMIGDFRAVLFCPAHLSLLSGGPAVRRTFIDIAVSQLCPAHAVNLGRYNRVLMQRNALIKESAIRGAGVRDIYKNGLWEVYAAQLAALGALVADARQNYMRVLSDGVAELFDKMTGGREVPALEYVTQLTDLGEETEQEDANAGKKSSSAETRHGEKFDLRSTAPPSEELERQLLENRERELRHGCTLYGVHRDDINIKLNGKEAKLYASQGQQRSIALAMKLAEGEAARRLSGEYPVYLLDDVLSELDGERQAFLLNMLEDRQIIVTSCDASLFGRSGGASLIHVSGGSVCSSPDGTPGSIG